MIKTCKWLFLYEEVIVSREFLHAEGHEKALKKVMPQVRVSSQRVSCGRVVKMVGLTEQLSSNMRTLQLGVGR